MATRYHVTALGVETEEVPDEEIPSSGLCGSNDSPESPAQKWKRRYDLLFAEHVQPVQIEINGETELHHVRALSVHDFDTMGACMARDGFTLWEFEDAEAQQSFYRALLFVGVCRENGAAYFGDPDEAREFYETRGPAAVVALTLRAALLKLNPYFSLPDAKKKAATGSGADAI